MIVTPSSSACVRVRPVSLAMAACSRGLETRSAPIGLQALASCEPSRQEVASQWIRRRSGETVGPRNPHLGTGTAYGASNQDVFDLANHPEQILATKVLP